MRTGGQPEPETPLTTAAAATAATALVERLRVLEATALSASNQRSKQQPCNCCLQRSTFELT